MPVKAEILSQLGTIFIRASGTLDVNDFLGTLTRILSRVPEQSDCRIIGDFVGVEEFDLTFAEVQEFMPVLTSAVEQTLKSLELDLIVTRVADYPLTRIFSQYANREANIVVRMHESFAEAAMAQNLRPAALAALVGTPST